MLTNIQGNKQKCTHMTTYRFAYTYICPEFICVLKIIIMKIGQSRYVLYCFIMALSLQIVWTISESTRMAMVIDLEFNISE